MIQQRIERQLNAVRVDKLLVIDTDELSAVFDYTAILAENGFRIVRYRNVEAFRTEYEETIKSSEERIAVIVNDDLYLPYDIQKAFRKVNLAFSELFPLLNADMLKKHFRDIDLLSYAYDNCYADATSSAQTERFIDDTAHDAKMIRSYCEEKIKLLQSMCDTAERYTDWIAVAKLKARILYFSTKIGSDYDLSFVDNSFASFVSLGYASLSNELGATAPSIITKTLPMIGGERNKVALIVMDGMSLFDFEIISRHLTNIEFELNGTFAVIPTMTPVSRQSLLSGKYPKELDKPFSLANEEKEFVAAGLKLGYTANQIQYIRGYVPDLSPFAKFVTVIMNEVDDIVHGQRQGRLGMFNDMNVLGKSGKLNALISTLFESGFTVYLTSDHGNTPCVGVGGFRSGVELETRSMRMAVLKDFAERNALLAAYADEYPGYYLDKNYRYFVCKPGVSFDSKGDCVMTHGGTTLDEVIVPFVRIREVL